MWAKTFPAVLEVGYFGILNARTSWSRTLSVLLLIEMINIDPIDEKLRNLVDDAKRLSYFHQINRETAQRRLVNEGDFLIRESSVALVEGKLKNICLSG